MWLDNTNGGEFDVPIGALVKMADSGQILIVDDEGKVHNSICITFILIKMKLFSNCYKIILHK